MRTSLRRVEEYIGRKIQRMKQTQISAFWVTPPVCCTQILRFVVMMKRLSAWMNVKVDTCLMSDEVIEGTDYHCGI